MNRTIDIAVKEKHGFPSTLSAVVVPGVFAAWSRP